MSKKQPLDVACPFCGAPVGQPCTNVRYEDFRDYGLGRVRQPHPQRVKAVQP